MVYNFNAGPSIMPKEVFDEAASAVQHFRGTGLSLLEIGHRTSLFSDVMEEARSRVRALMQLDDAHEVLFLHGGASTQFMQVPMNLLETKESAAYADTGVWSAKAIKEARLFGKVDVVCSSKEQGYRHIPTDFAVPNEARYFHITTNNTVFGTQWKKIPKTSNPLVADMSSDIFSRRLSFNDFALIYAGAQKNLGPAGVTLVVVQKDLLGKIRRPIPTMMDYRNHITEKSMLNTPPVFAVYVCLLMLRWLEKEGGIDEMERRSLQKAQRLYEAIDQSNVFDAPVRKEDRSLMNVCFNAIDDQRAALFLEYATEQGIVGIKGHRLAGGFRASLYNALPVDAVDVLVQALTDFEQRIA
jgi:phosphoserine aminotransferase